MATHKEHLDCSGGGGGERCAYRFGSQVAYGSEKGQKPNACAHFDDLLVILIPSVILFADAASIPPIHYCPMMFCTNCILCTQHRMCGAWVIRPISLDAAFWHILDIGVYLAFPWIPFPLLFLCFCPASIVQLRKLSGTSMWHFLVTRGAAATVGEEGGNIGVPQQCNCNWCLMMCPSGRGRCERR